MFDTDFVYETMQDAAQSYYSKDFEMLNFDERTHVCLVVVDSLNMHFDRCLIF